MPQRKPPTDDISKASGDAVYRISDVAIANWCSVSTARRYAPDLRVVKGEKQRTYNAVEFKDAVQVVQERMRKSSSQWVPREIQITDRGVAIAFPKRSGGTIKFLARRYIAYLRARQSQRRAEARAEKEAKGGWER